jgi:hypothetical protein
MRYPAMELRRDFIPNNVQMGGGKARTVLLTGESDPLSGKGFVTSSQKQMLMLLERYRTRPEHNELMKRICYRSPWR